MTIYCTLKPQNKVCINLHYIFNRFSQSVKHAPSIYTAAMKHEKLQQFEDIILIKCLPLVLLFLMIILSRPSAVLIVFMILMAIKETIFLIYALLIIEFTKSDHRCLTFLQQNYLTLITLGIMAGADSLQHSQYF